LYFFLSFNFHNTDGFSLSFHPSSIYFLSLFGLVVSKKQCDCAIDVTGDSRAVDLSKINWRQLIKKWYCSHRLLGLVVVVRMTPTESMQFEEANIHLASAKYPSPTIGGKVRRGRRMAHMEETVVTLMLSTFLIVDDSSELAAGDELTASDELVFTS
jgi:hypothetical protein